MQACSERILSSLSGLPPLLPPATAMFSCSPAKPRSHAGALPMAEAVRSFFPEIRLHPD